MANVLRRVVGWRSFWPIAALVLLLGFNCACFPSRFAFVRDGRLRGTLNEVLQQGSTVMLLSVGMTLVIATAGIDLSVGSVMAVAGAVAALMISHSNVALAWIIAGGLAIALVAGLWNGVLVAFVRLQPIVATLVLLVAGRGVAQLLTGGHVVTFDQTPFQFLGKGSLAGLPFPVFLAAGVALGAWLVTRWTNAGLYIEAVGNNERAARLSGLSPGRVRLLVYGFSGLCAGVAGLIETAYISAADINECGKYIELDAILAVVIGGTSFSGGRANILGSVVGALVMRTLTTTIQMLDVPPAYTLVVKALTVVVVCSLSSERVQAMVRRAVGPRRHTA